MAIKTFNIDDATYRRFSEFCRTHGLSMSRQVEIFIKAQLEENKEVREEYLQRLDVIRRGKFIKVGSFDNFKKRYK